MRDVGDVDADLDVAVPGRVNRERVVMVARVLGVDGEAEALAQVEPTTALVGAGLGETVGLRLRRPRERRAQSVLGSDGVVVPLGPVVGAQDLDQQRRALVRDLGDAVVPVVGRMRAVPGQLTTAAAPATSGVEDPSTPLVMGATEKARRVLVVLPLGSLTGSASYGDSSASASCACASRSSCACASFRSPSVLLAAIRWPPARGPACRP
jgi:hypothetical protein